MLKREAIIPEHLGFSSSPTETAVIIPIENPVIEASIQLHVHQQLP